MKTNIFTLLLSLFLFQTINATQLAFPEAEGFGRFAKGGRGGTVYHVTNLNDTGTGSFRDAVSKPNRIIVFDVGGIIKIASPITVSPYITIAGETAPGDGICIYGNAVAVGGANHTIVRYIRIRMGIIGKDGGDAVGISNGIHIIFDHVSISWGRDGTLDMNRYSTQTLDSITFQDCIISHGLQPHSTGGLMQTNGHFSVLRSLYIHNWTRNPKQTCNHQYVNNVVYNWGASCYNFGGGTFDTYSNVTNNYFICGVGSTRDGIVGGDSSVYAYFKGNYFDKNRNGLLDGVEFTNYSTLLNRLTVPNNYPALKNEMTAREAYFSIIANAGASFRRDEVDKNLMLDLQSVGKEGFFITKEDTLPTKGPGIIKSGTPIEDTDKDGMPDQWEIKNGLDYQNPADATKDSNGDGYLNIENYIHSITKQEMITMQPQLSDAAISVYPNPVTNKLLINLSESLLPSSIQLTDAAGKIMYQTNTNRLNYSIDMQQYKSGIYLLVVRSGKQEWMRKIVR